MHPLISALVAGITSIVLVYYSTFIPPLGIAFFSAAAAFYIYWYAVAGFLPILIIGYAISRNYFVAPIVCLINYRVFAGLDWHRLSIFALALLTGSLLLFAVTFWWSRRRKR